MSELAFLRLFAVCGALWRKTLEALIPLFALLVFAGAFCRYFFAYNPAWMGELAQFMHAIVFLSLAGFAIRDDKHVRIDIFYERFSLKTRRAVLVLGYVFLLLPYCLTIAYFSCDFISASWRIKEGSSEYQGMPGIFILKTFIWGYAACLLIDGARVMLFRSGLTEKTGKAEASA